MPPLTDALPFLLSNNNNSDENNNANTQDFIDELNFARRDCGIVYESSENAKNVGRANYDMCSGSSDDDGENHDSDDEVILEKGETVFKRFISTMNKFLDEAEDDQNLIRNQSNTTTKLLKRLDKRDDYVKYIKALDPNMNEVTKREQLEMRQRFRDAINNKKLSPLSLHSHRIMKMKSIDDRLLEGLSIGGATQFVIAIGLAMFFALVAILTDRGYKKFSIFYPNLNKHIYPSFLEGRKQFDYEEQEKDIDIKRLRYTCETVFARVTNSRFFSSIIKYEDFSLIEDGLSWAMAMANMYKPLREPGDWNKYLREIG